MARPKYPSDFRPHNAPGYRSPKRQRIFDLVSLLRPGESWFYRPPGEGRQWGVQCTICDAVSLGFSRRWHSGWSHIGRLLTLSHWVVVAPPCRCPPFRLSLQAMISCALLPIPGRPPDGGPAEAVTAGGRRGWREALGSFFEGVRSAPESGVAIKATRLALRGVRCGRVVVRREFLVDRWH